MSILVRNVKIFGSSKQSEELQDVLVSGETISAIGNFKGKRTEETIDGQGAYLLPGFIDFDTTSDHFLSIFTGPKQESFIRQGVTTIIGGHCGASLAPLLYGSLEAIRKWADPASVHINWHTMQEFLQDLSRHPLGVNFGTFAGHSTIRRAIVGEDMRELAPNEIKIFESVLSRAIKEGAFGISFGLSSIHTRATPYSELVTLAGISAKEHSRVALHLRHGGVAKGIEEAVKLNRETGVAVFINHFVPRLGEEKEYETALEKLAALPKEAAISFGIYPFAGRIEPIFELLPEWAKNGNLETMRKNVQDAWLGKRILADLPLLDPAMVTIETAPQAGLQSRTLRQYMDIFGITDVQKGLFELMRRTDLRAVISRRDVNEKLLGQALWHPRALPTSHAASLSEEAQGNTIMALRAKRTMVEFLRQGEERKDLQGAVRKITAIPAAMLDLKRRGYIEEGYFADLVLMKKGEVNTVFVNGRIVLRDGITTSALPGKILHRI